MYQYRPFIHVYCW